MSVKKASVEQVFCKGQWINKSPFRCFLHSATESKVAESWEQYQDMITSGHWFHSSEEASKPVKKPKKVVEPSLAVSGDQDNGEPDSNAIHN